MAVTNLTNTVWLINDDLSTASYLDYYSIDFSAGGGTYAEIQYDDDTQELQYEGSIVYSQEWYSQVDRTISITGGTDVENSTLITWLETNAVQQSSAVTYKHILKDGSKVQVDSAIRDGQGVKIDTNYAKKTEIPTTASQVGAVAEKPDGTHDLISSNKISTTYLPDYLLGQMLYGGSVTGAGVATLSTNAQSKLGTSSASITLTNDTTAITGYQANEGIYYVVSSTGTFASLSLAVGDWLISTGSAWQKIDNTDAVTSVNGQTGAITGLMTTANPTGTGSLSLNRKANTTVGNYSVAEGYQTEASSQGAHAEGYGTTASGIWQGAHAEGYYTISSSQGSHAEGYYTTASGQGSHAEGYHATANGLGSHAEGYQTTASGRYSHAEGQYTTAQRQSQHTFGEYNVLDTTGTTTSRGDYVEIVGNGTTSNARSNARTLDWSGNEYLAGTLTTTGLKSATSSSYKLAIPTTTGWTADKTIATTDQIPASITITTTAGSQSVSDGTNTLNFGSNAFNSTTIPTSYVSSVNGSTGAITGIIDETELDRYCSDFLIATDLLDYVYPVGSVYMSTQNTSPASFLGGTWTQITAGRALWSITSGTGGQDIAGSLPNLTGQQGLDGVESHSGTGSGVYSTSGGAGRWYGAGHAGGDYFTLRFDASKSNSVYSASAGTDVVRPTSIGVYMWKRTA